MSIQSDTKLNETAKRIASVMIDAVQDSLDQSIQNDEMVKIKNRLEEDPELASLVSIHIKLHFAEVLDGICDQYENSDNDKYSPSLKSYRKNLKEG